MLEPKLDKIKTEISNKLDSSSPYEMLVLSRAINHYFSKKQIKSQDIDAHMSDCKLWEAFYKSNLKKQLNLKYLIENNIEQGQQEILIESLMGQHEYSGQSQTDKSHSKMMTLSQLVNKFGQSSKLQSYVIKGNDQKGQYMQIKFRHQSQFKKEKEKEIDKCSVTVPNKYHELINQKSNFVSINGNQTQLCLKINQLRKEVHNLKEVNQAKDMKIIRLEKTIKDNSITLQQSEITKTQLAKLTQQMQLLKSALPKKK